MQSQPSYALTIAMAMASAESLGNVLAVSATAGQLATSFAPMNALIMGSAWRELVCAWQASWAWIAQRRAAAVVTVPATIQELVFAMWGGMAMIAQRSSCVLILAALGMALAQVVCAIAPQASLGLLVQFKMVDVTLLAAKMAHAIRSRKNVSVRRARLAPRVCPCYRATVPKIATIADCA